VFLLGEDGVVGLQAVLLEHLLIAVGVSDVVSCDILLICDCPYPKPVQCHTSVVVKK
jgi:hypothetical protein